MINKKIPNNCTSNTMKSQKISTKKIAFLLSSIGVLACANANQFEPSTTPIFSTPQAKPNIHMVLDDSGSMVYADVIAPEHAFGFGQPTCQYQGTEWAKEREERGEYDPFRDGVYKPWNDTIAANGGYYGKKKPPRIMNCAFVMRKTALDNAVRTLLYKYREQAYLGISVLWQVNNIGNNDIFDSLIRVPLDDYSTLSSDEFEKEVVNPISTLIKNSPGQTPLYPAVYEAIKMFRGQPVTLLGTNTDNIYMGANIKRDEENRSFYAYKFIETPLRYRCQQNHMIVMTDGEPNQWSVRGVDSHDGLFASKMDNGSYKVVNDVYIADYSDLVKGTDIGKITSSVDLRKVHKPMYKNDQWIEKTLDDAGKPWIDELSSAMPIITHSVSLFVDPLSRVYLDMTEPTGGMNLGFGKDQGNAEDLLLAFDTIFSSIIKSTSSTMSTNDRNNADVLEGKPTDASGNADLSKVGTIRYDTTYNFSQQKGNIRAMAPYISGHIEEDGEEKPIIDVVELWNTDDTIKSEQGNYVTFLADHQGELTHLSDPNVKKRFEEIHKENHYGESFNPHYIEWLTSGGNSAGGDGLRARLRPMGSITNSNLILANKDILNINIAKDKMAQPLAKELVEYVKYKAKYQPANYLIVSDNDGFINFVNAQRGLSNYEKAGARNTAYFPQLLAHRLGEIAGDNRPATLVLEGKSKLADVKVYDRTYGDVYATLGISSMGSGGKGVVGYRIYGATADLKQPSKDSILEKVTPLFEITNEGPKAYRTKGFEDLGYTYSNFEIFNQKNGKKGQAVAAFGNGFGVDKSVLYFIDAYTGEKLHEIILNQHGGGAATPSIVVSASEDGQKLERIYVGDYSGQLYRINFQGKKLTDDSVTVTALFKAASLPDNEGQSAISVKPLVTKNKSTGLYSIAFGTGNAASHQLDRGQNSLVEHSVYNVVDQNHASESATATVKTLMKPNAKLSTLLTVANLKVGDVKYASGANIDYYSEEKHDLEITAPDSSNPAASQNGWAIRLVADGNASGERTIQNAKYDSEDNNIVFVTWGIHERDNGYVVGDLYDPCLSDTAFGKVLSFDAKTGKSSGKHGIYNKGSTGTAEGGLTGNGITDSPEGNDIADLEDFQKGLEDEISSITGDEDTSYPSTEDNTKLDCIGDIFGQLECKETIVEDHHEPLPQGRVNFKKINAYY